MSAWILAALAFAAAFLPMSAAPPSWPRSAVKTAPLLLLAAGSALAGAPVMLIAGLVFSAAGDFALSRPGPRAFLAGLGLFAVAHLAYIVLFWRINPGEAPALTLILPLALLALSTEFWLLPHVGRIAWPVRLYVGLIAVMVFAALALTDSPSIAIGALLFLVSDVLLAIREFRLGGRGRRGWDWAVWVLYVAGQVLIVLGALPIAGISD